MATKQPIATRRRILDAAFWEIYRNGFQRASIDRILDGTSMTKGALFHHFPNKQQLGFAVIDESVREWIRQCWITPLSSPGDPIDGLSRSLRTYLDGSPEEIIHGGCPLNNLTQELAGMDEAFRLRLAQILSEWRAAVADAWRRGQADRVVRADVDADRMAGFVVSSIEGLLGAAKSAKSRASANDLAAVLTGLLEPLRRQDPERP